LADVLIVSGAATGSATNISDVRRVKEAAPDAPVWVGSGVTHENVGEVLRFADGAIVGSAFEADGRAGNTVNVEQVRRLVDVARRTR
jgi:predicted TIM-barrel enzyme